MTETTTQTTARRCTHCRADVAPADIAGTGYYRCPSCWTLTTPEAYCPRCEDWHDAEDGCPFPTEPDAYVCVDCAMILANGDDSGIPPELLADVLAGCEAHPTLVPLGEEYDHDFSSSPCDCCGTRLAGYRHGCTDLTR